MWQYALEVYIGSDINGVHPTRQNIQQTQTRPDTRTAKTGRPEPDPTRPELSN